jgi:hypothetical protein
MSITSTSTIKPKDQYLQELKDKVAKRPYFDPSSKHNKKIVKCKIRIISTSEEIINSKDKFYKEYYTSKIQVIKDNRKFGNQKDKTLFWNLPQSIINKIALANGEKETFGTIINVVCDNMLNKHRYYNSTIVKEDFGINIRTVDDIEKTTIREGSQDMYSTSVPTMSSSEFKSIKIDIKALREKQLQSYPSKWFKFKYNEYKFHILPFPDGNPLVEVPMHWINKIPRVCHVENCEHCNSGVDLTLKTAIRIQLVETSDPSQPLGTYITEIGYYQKKALIACMLDRKWESAGQMFKYIGNEDPKKIQILMESKIRDILGVIVDYPKAMIIKSLRNNLKDI